MAIIALFGLVHVQAKGFSVPLKKKPLTKEIYENRKRYHRQQYALGDSYTQTLQNFEDAQVRGSDELNSSQFFFFIYSNA